jgi:hypothetical protein
MLTELFNRAELVNLSGMRHQATYRLEERNILTPCNKQYNYNQVIFCRTLDQIRKAMGSGKMTFADGFGPRGQFEIDWASHEFMYFSAEGAGFVPEDPSGAMEALTNEWFPDLKKEVVLMSSNQKEVRDFFMEHFRVVPKNDTTIALVLLRRVRAAINEAARKQGLFSKLEVAQNLSSDYALVG